MKNLLNKVDQYELENALEKITENELLEIAEKLEIKDVKELDLLTYLIANDEIVFYKGFSEKTMIEYLEEENYGLHFSELPEVIKENFNFEKFFEDECKYNVLKISTGFITLHQEIRSL